MVRPRLASLVLLALVPLAACGDDAVPKPTLTVEGVTAGPHGVAYFPATSVGASSTLAVEIVNDGDAALSLTASPPLRLERDDVLAFAVTQPEARTLAPGEAAAFTLTFTPRGVGAATAQLVIATSAAAFPELTLDLSGEGVDPGAPALALALDDVSAPTAWSPPTTATGARRTATLRLTNVGDGLLTFASPTAFALSGPDADAFSASPPDAATLDPGASATSILAFAPTHCGPHAALLTTASDAAPLTLTLTADGVVSPDLHAGLADTSLLELPDLTLVSSADGTRLAVANPADATFAGLASAFAFDGCALTPSLTADASTVAYSGGLFASAAALSADGDTLLVTARDFPTAWLFDLATPTAAPVPLSSTDGTVGHGRAAALSADADVVLTGQPLAATASVAHGAAFLWRRPESGWSAQPQATFKLLPRDLATTERLGQTVALSADADVLALAALVRLADDRQAPAALLYLRDGDTWGRERLATNTHVRNPTLRLSAPGSLPSDGTVRVAVAADGDTVAFSVAESGGAIALLLFERTGPAAFGVPEAADVDAELPGFGPTVRLRLTGSPAWRFALTPDGATLLGGDASGVRAFDRPEAGWNDAVVPLLLSDLPVFGDLALGRDGAFVAALTPAGDLRIFWR